MPTLTIIKGPEKGRALHISSKEKEPMIIGRKEVMYSINDPLASRKHAQFLYKDGKWYIRDLKSSNGTFLNGDKLEKPKRLHNGDIIQIGTSKVLVGKPAKKKEAETDEPDTSTEEAVEETTSAEEPVEQKVGGDEPKPEPKKKKKPKTIRFEDSTMDEDDKDASSILLDVFDSDFGEPEEEDDDELPDYLPDYDPLDPATHRKSKNKDGDEDDKTIVVPGDMLAKIAEEIGDIDDDDDVEPAGPDDQTIDADDYEEAKKSKK